jgi:hypothetical protein
VRLWYFQLGALAKGIRCRPPAIKYTNGCSYDATLRNPRLVAQLVDAANRDVAGKRDKYAGGCGRGGLPDAARLEFRHGTSAVPLGIVGGVDHGPRCNDVGTLGPGHRADAIFLGQVPWMSGWMSSFGLSWTVYHDRSDLWDLAKRLLIRACRQGRCRITKQPL